MNLKEELEEQISQLIQELQIKKRDLDYKIANTSTNIDYVKAHLEVTDIMQKYNVNLSDQFVIAMALTPSWERQSFLERIFTQTIEDLKNNRFRVTPII